MSGSPCNRTYVDENPERGRKLIKGSEKKNEHLQVTAERRKAEEIMKRNKRRGKEEERRNLE